MKKPILRLGALLGLRVLGVGEAYAEETKDPCSVAVRQEIEEWESRWGGQYQHLDNVCQSRFRNLQYWIDGAKKNCDAIAALNDVARLRLEEELRRDARSAYTEARAAHDKISSCRPTRSAGPFLEFDSAFALVPSFGGDVMGACSAQCTKTLGFGFLVLGRGGYRFVSGFMVGVDAGYLFAVQKASGRPTAVQPTNLPANPGTADDTLRLSAVRLGASAGVRLGSSIPVTLRLGTGVLLGTLRDDRTGTFTTVERPANPIMQYSVQETDTPSVLSLYIAPEARVGLRLGSRIELSASLEVLTVIALATPRWTKTFAASTDGQGTFDDALSGKLMAVITPGLGVRYDF